MIPDAMLTGRLRESLWECLVHTDGDFFFEESPGFTARARAVNIVTTFFGGEKVVCFCESAQHLWSRDPKVHGKSAGPLLGYPFVQAAHQRLRMLNRKVERHNCTSPQDNLYDF